MKLKKRNIDLMEGINYMLELVIETELNKLTDGEFVDVLIGHRGNFSLLQTGNGSFKLCELTCICGGIHNIPCQWLKSAESCNGKNCSNYRR